jgi:hypothetical protein
MVVDKQLARIAFFVTPFLPRFGLILCEPFDTMEAMARARRMTDRVAGGAMGGTLAVRAAWL